METSKLENEGIMQNTVSQISWHRMFELQLAYWRGGAKVRIIPFDILTLFGCFHV